MKMNHKAIAYILLLCLSASFYACKEDAFEQVIEIEIPEHEPRIALALEMGQGDEVIQTFVSRSSSINEIVDAPILEDVTVNILKNGGQFAEMVFDSTTRDYFATVEPLQNDNATYRIEVESPIYGKATAEQKLPAMVAFENLEYEEDGTIDTYGERVDVMSFEINDPADVENYYAIELFSFFRFNGDTTLFIQNLYPTTLDPLLESVNNGEIIFADDSFNGNKHVINLNLDKYSVDLDGMEEFVILINFQNISRDNYLYKRSLYTYWNSINNPFAEPVIVHNNIENGYGIFRTGTVYSEEIKLK